MQSREQCNQKLQEALYKVFKVKQLPAAPEVKRTPAEPLEIKAIFAPGHCHIYVKVQYLKVRLALKV